MLSKVCFKCGELKPLDQFHKHKMMSDGHLNKCGVCTTNDVRLWREKKGKKEDRQQRYARELEMGKRSRLRSLDEIRVLPVSATPRTKKESKHLYYLATKELVSARARVWQKQNKHKVRAHRVERYNTDPLFRLRVTLARRIGMAFKHNYKSATTMELVGCSIAEAKKCIESQFAEGMSWQNWGEWHIDHKIPFAAFDLSVPENQRKVCHYTNLQPLWAKDNLKKGAKH